LFAIKLKLVTKGVNVREESKKILFVVFTSQGIMKLNHGGAFTI